MVFSTPIFLYGFLPLMLAVYYLLPRPVRNGWLVAGSYFFYGWGNPLYILLLLFSTLLDFACALSMPGAGRRTRRILHVLRTPPPGPWRLSFAGAHSLLAWANSSFRWPTARSAVL